MSLSRLSGISQRELKVTYGFAHDPTSSSTNLTKRIESSASSYHPRVVLIILESHKENWKSHNGPNTACSFPWESHKENWKLRSVRILPGPWSESHKENWKGVKEAAYYLTAKRISQRELKVHINSLNNWLCKGRISQRELKADSSCIWLKLASPLSNLTKRIESVLEQQGNSSDR